MKTENILKIKNICKAYPQNRLRKRNKKNGVLSIFNALFFEKEEMIMDIRTENEALK